jgi:hypothetical protein
MKLILKTLKPRNPMVALSRQRHAGSHQPSAGARRQQDRRALRLEVDRLRPSP